MRISLALLRHRAAVAALALAAPACSIAEQTPPAISGPSEFSLVLSTTVSAATIQRDGASQSTITVSARNETGGPAVGRRIVLALNAPTDTQLSASNVVIGPDGRATVDVFAPPSTSFGDVITVGLTPVDEAGQPQSVTRTVQIGLTPSNPGRPTAQFSFTPVSPTVADTITFNASASQDEGAACGGNCTYTWDFGDGTTASGVIATKNFPTTGTRLVRLTVTDAGGAATSSSQSVNVGVPAAPTVGTIVFGPTPVVEDRATNFDAGGATVGAGATIESFTWVWGDGETTTTSGAQTQHTFRDPGTFTVRVTVRDNFNRTATGTVSVTVTAP